MRMTLGRFALISTIGILLLPWLDSGSARASLIDAISVSDLFRQSEQALLVVPGQAESHWETLGGSRRIVTDTELIVKDVAKGNGAPGQVLLVRTLGGTVGEIAQLVPGEATVGGSGEAFLFLDEDDQGQNWVTGMAQGHYPVLRSKTGEGRLQPSPGLHGVRHPEKSAVRQLVGRTLTELLTILADSENQ